MIRATLTGIVCFLLGALMMARQGIATEVSVFVRNDIGTVAPDLPDALGAYCGIGDRPRQGVIVLSARNLRWSAFQNTDLLREHTFDTLAHEMLHALEQQVGVLRAEDAIEQLALGHSGRQIALRPASNE